MTHFSSFRRKTELTYYRYASGGSTQTYLDETDFSTDKMPPREHKSTHHTHYFDLVNFPREQFPGEMQGIDLRDVFIRPVVTHRFVC
jgi:hypothetical protein